MVDYVVLMEREYGLWSPFVTGHWHCLALSLPSLTDYLMTPADLC